MKLVLLSGGSGTRLWPLSNKLKPKQFIEILQNDHGDYESMFQRVIGQIKQSRLTNDTFIATIKHQMDLIQSQLIDDIPLIIEPNSRDTFPAISLAAVFLYEKMNFSMDEVVCVFPVDIYADVSFFQTLHKAEYILQKHPYNLVLIGIEPTFPAEKYGYILSEKVEGSLLRVKKFIEKPRKERAMELLAQSAMWNGGVFCFKLGFLIDILQERGIPLIYEEIVEQYHQLPNISFDYEVVEKLDSIAVVPYEGEWDDLGTWDTLTSKMEKSTIGKGYLCEKSMNTHIINHLDIPVLGIGLSDMVVVANEHGILISDKLTSIQLKKSVYVLETMQKT